MVTLRLVLNTRMNGYPETSSKYRDDGERVLLCRSQDRNLIGFGITCS